jgi:hypothetical protein
VTPEAARHARLRPLLESRFEALKIEIGRLAGLIDVCGTGRDPLHSPRLVPTYRKNIADAQSEWRAIEERIAEFEYAHQFDWMDQ